MSNLNAPDSKTRGRRQNLGRKCTQLSDALSLPLGVLKLKHRLREKNQGNPKVEKHYYRA